MLVQKAQKIQVSNDKERNRYNDEQNDWIAPFVARRLVRLLLVAAAALEHLRSGRVTALS